MPWRGGDRARPLPALPRRRARAGRGHRLGHHPGRGGGRELHPAARARRGRRGGDPGDVIVLIEEKEHACFRRKGSDLVLELPITYSTAALGGPEEIPTLDGKVALDIPRGIQSGKVLRLRGKGLPSLRDGRRGDILVRVHIWVPDKPGDEEQELLGELRKVESKPPDPGEKRAASWFERMRDSWGS